MENPFDAIRRAVQEARQINMACAEQANTFADLIDGRLRNVSSYRLARLKKAATRPQCTHTAAERVEP